jgi:hypothetical protein
MLTLARMYYLFYTGLGPKSEGGNDHLQYHANFSAMVAKEILPEFYSAKDFKAQCEREMLLGSLDGVTDIQHPTYGDISELPDVEKRSDEYEALCKLDTPFFKKFQSLQSFERLKKEKNQKWNGL